MSSHRRSVQASVCLAAGVCASKDVSSGPAGTTLLRHDHERFHQNAPQSSCKRVLFTNYDGATIHGGYHLTELKAASFDTVDCGGQKNQWKETIAQLWVPDGKDNDEFMTSRRTTPSADDMQGA